MHWFIYCWHAGPMPFAVWNMIAWLWWNACFYEGTHFAVKLFHISYRIWKQQLSMRQVQHDNEPVGYRVYEWLFSFWFIFIPSISAIINNANANKQKLSMFETRNRLHLVTKYCWVVSSHGFLCFITLSLFVCTTRLTTQHPNTNK